jgi:hypothetical protein
MRQVARPFSCVTSAGYRETRKTSKARSEVEVRLPIAPPSGISGIQLPHAFNHTSGRALKSNPFLLETRASGFLSSSKSGVWKNQLVHDAVHATSLNNTVRVHERDMNFWLFSLIGRIFAGEPLEKSTRSDVQLYGSAFAWMPVFIVIGMFTLKLLESSPAWIIWVTLTILASAYFFIWFRILRRLPLWLLIVIAGIAWPAFAMFTWYK